MKEDKDFLFSNEEKLIKVGENSSISKGKL